MDRVENHRIPYRRSELQDPLNFLPGGRRSLLFQKRFGKLQKSFRDLPVRSRKRSIARRMGPALCHVWEPVEENGSRLVTGVGLKHELQPIARVWPPFEMML